MLDHNVVGFSIQDHSSCKKLTFESWCIESKSYWLSKRGWRFWMWCDEQEDQPRVTPLPKKSNYAAKAIINLFTLQHIDQEINDVKLHHVGNECGGQSITRRKTCIFDYSLWLNFSRLRQVTCDKLVAKKKSINTFHPLTPLYTYCHMWLRCNYFGHDWKQIMCCPVS